MKILFGMVLSGRDGSVRLVYCFPGRCSHDRHVIIALEFKKSFWSCRATQRPPVVQIRSVVRSQSLAICRKVIFLIYGEQTRCTAWN